MKKLHLWLLVAAAVALTACSGGNGSGTDETEGIVDYVATPGLLYNLEGDIIKLPSNLERVNNSVNGIFSAYDTEKRLYFFYKAEQNPQPIGEGYQAVGAFTGKYAPVLCQDEIIRYIDREGNVAFETLGTYDAGNFFSGRALMATGNGMGGIWYGYYDENGELAIPAEYYAAYRFSDGYAVVWKDESEWAVIDRDGKEVMGDVANHAIPAGLDEYGYMGVSEGYLLALSPDKKTLFVYDINHPGKTLEMSLNGKGEVYTPVWNGRFLLCVNQEDRKICEIKDGEITPVLSDVYDYNGVYAERVDDEDYSTDLVRLSDMKSLNTEMTLFNRDVKGYDKVVGTYGGDSYDKLIIGNFNADEPIATIELDRNFRETTFTVQLYETLLGKEVARVGVVKSTKGEVAADNSVVAEGPTLNANFLGEWSNNNDPNIAMEVSETIKKYESGKGYGYLSAANEYFETDFTLVFTSLTPDGENIRVKYDKMNSYFTGDPDDFDSEGEWKTEKVGTGELTLIPIGNNKLKITSSESRIKGVILYKRQ